VIPFLPPA